MIQTKELQAEGFYLLQGKANANSVFIEDKSEAIHFIKEANLRFIGFFKIHDYLISKDGWNFLVSIEDELIVRESYLHLRSKSKKANRTLDKDKVWSMISEQVRHFLSSFIKYTNKKQGRTGGKVHSSYERYWFESEKEASKYIQNMKHQYVRLCQKLKRYRGKKSHFRFSKSEAKGSIFLCSMKLKPRDVIGAFGAGCLYIMNEINDVLEVWIKNTKNLHSNFKTGQKAPLVI